MPTTLTTIRERVRRALKDEKSYQVEACESGWTTDDSNVTVSHDTSV